MNTSVPDLFPIEGRAGSLHASIGETLQAIDALHKIPKRAPIPIILSGRMRGQGAYEFQSTVPNNPVRISIHARATHPRMTVAHEIGHFLDNQVLHALKQGFASEYDEIFSPLIIGWEQTGMVRKLRRILSRNAARISPRDRNYIRTLLSPPELWAATYAQWVAIRSGHPMLTAELEREIGTFGLVGDEMFTTQREHDDFKDIMRMVDELLRQRGLR